MRTQIIFTDKEWEDYTASFAVGKTRHVPKIAPSFPVLVISTMEPNPYYGDSKQAEHSFIEVAELKRMLGIASN